MSDACMGSAWRIDKRVNLGTLLSLACSLCVVAGLVSGLTARLGMVEDKLIRLEERVEESRGAAVDTAIKVERMEERVLGMQRGLLELRNEIRDEIKAEREAR